MRASKWELALALVLATALVVLGAAFGSTRKNDADPRRSTLNDSRNGLHALYALLEVCGSDPRRMMKPLSAGDPTDRTVVLAQPSEPVTKREVAQLVEWVDAGGRLVVVGGGPQFGAFESSTQPVLEAFGLEETSITRLAGEEMHVDGEGLSTELRRIDWPATWAVWADTHTKPGANLEWLVSSDRRCLVGRVARGDAGGEVVVVSDALLLDNASLSKDDNAVLAVRLLSGRETIEFDEFHHGFSADGGADHLAGVLASMLVETWPGRAVLLVALAGLVFLAGAAVRFGAPEPEPLPARRSLSEHAEALGRIFESAGARTEVLRILAAGAIRVVGPRTGIPASIGPKEFAQRLRAASSPGAAELAHAIERATSARAMRDSDLVATAADLAEAKRRYLHGGR